MHEKLRINLSLSSKNDFSNAKAKVVYEIRIQRSWTSVSAQENSLSYVVLQEGSKNKFRKGGISHE